MKSKTNKKKRSLIFRFFSIVFISVFSFLVISSIVLAGYIYTTINGEQFNKNNSNHQNGNGSNNIIDNIFKPKQVKTNVAIFGVDEEGIRTDVMIVAGFDSETMQINMLSIPRDTKVKLTDLELQDLQSRNSNIVPRLVKINEIHAYAGKEDANEYSVRALEKLLNIKIDYFVKMNFEGFRKIVDTLGGVEVEVPRDMYYVDPTQDLYINLKKGVQRLNGAQSEQLVRYRKGYSNGDIGRIDVQQSFLKALAKEALSERNILKALDIVHTLYNYVETDFGIDDITKYIKYLGDINLDNIHMATIPGESVMIGDRSFYEVDGSKLQDQVQEMFYEKKEEDDKKLVDSKNLNIEILNGGNKSGLAASKKEELEEEGYTIQSVGTYTEERKDYTQIIVAEKGMGQDLLQYFYETKVKVDPEALPDGTDIQIVLGLQEK